MRLVKNGFLLKDFRFIKRLKVNFFFQLFPSVRILGMLIKDPKIDMTHKKRFFKMEIYTQNRHDAQHLIQETQSKCAVTLEI